MNSPPAGPGVHNPVWLWRQEGLKGNWVFIEASSAQDPSTNGRYPRYVNLAESYCTLKELAIVDDDVVKSFGGEEEEAEAEEASGDTRRRDLRVKGTSNRELERKTGRGEGQEEAIAMAS